MPQITRGPHVTFVSRRKEFEAEVANEVDRRLRVMAVTMQNKVKVSLSRSATSSGPSAPGDYPHVRTGMLRNSIFLDNPKPHVFRVGTSVGYGVALHEGATIRPTKARALSIPVSPEAERHGRSPRSFPTPLTFIPRKGGNVVGLLVEKTGGDTFKTHYVLVRSVRIAKRPFLTKALGELKPTFRAMIARPMPGSP